MICRRSSPARRRSEASSSHRMFRFTSELIFSLCSKEARGFHHLLLSGLKQKGFPYSLSFFFANRSSPTPPICSSMASNDLAPRSSLRCVILNNITFFCAASNEPLCGFGISVSRYRGPFGLFSHITRLRVSK